MCNIFVAVEQQHCYMMMKDVTGLSLHNHKIKYNTVCNIVKKKQKTES